MIIDELIALLGYKVEGQAALNQYNKSLDNLEKKAYAVGQAIGRTAAIAGTLAAAGFAFLGKSVIDVSAQFETYQATLETIEGSAEKAKASLDWVTQFAKTTPYNVDEVTRAFVKLKSYGLDPMDGTLEFLGDTASGMGKNLNMAVEALADAVTNQFERLKEFGITAKQSGDDVTFSWTENGKAMTKTVKKNSVEITKALKGIWGTKFAGAMIRQSKTWVGMMSNLGDSWTAFLRKVGEHGFFDKAKESLAGLMDSINTAFDDGTVDKLADSLSNAFSAVIRGFAAFATRMAFYIQLISKNWSTAKPILQGIGIALGLLFAATSPVITAIAALAIVIDDLIAYMTGGESVIGDFVGWIKSLGTAFAETKIGGDIVNLIGKIVQYFKDGTQWVQGFVEALAGITPTSFGTGWEVFKGVISGIFDVLKQLAGLITGAANWLFPTDAFGAEPLKAGAEAARMLLGILNSILEMPARITEAFKNMIISIPSPAMPNVTMPSGTPGGDLTGLTPQGMGARAGANIGAMAGRRGAAGAATVNQSNQNTSNVNVGGVNVNVQNSTQAPAATGAAVGNAIGKAATQPATRLETEPAL